MSADPNSKSNWTIEFHFENVNQKLRLAVDEEIVLGRRDSAHSDSDLIDLLPFGAGEFGTSRRHAALRWQSGTLCIVDLNSANGTALNGLRIEPGIANRLSEGDQLHLGHLAVKVHLNELFTQTTVQARRVDVDNRYVPSAGKGQRILIVEDDPALSELYKIALERAGFTVQVSRDVISAMRVLNQFTPALIVLDMMLPGVQGLELARYIRRDSNGPAIPIIVSSALNDPQTIKQAMEDGVDVYLTKPPNLKELVHIVSQVIERNERTNPSMHTKQLRGTAALDSIAATPRNDTIVIFVEDRREPLAALVQPSITLGRRLTGSAARAHVDLEDLQAFDRGVSRVHARITRNNHTFTLTDLGSSNGTFLNGKNLKPNEEFPIANGDEVRLGEMKLRVYMLGDTKDLAPLADDEPELTASI